MPDALDRLQADRRAFGGVFLAVHRGAGDIDFVGVGAGVLLYIDFNPGGDLAGEVGGSDRGAGSVSDSIVKRSKHCGDL